MYLTHTCWPPNRTSKYSIIPLGPYFDHRNSSFLLFDESVSVMFNCLINIESVIVYNGIPDGIIFIQRLPLTLMNGVPLLLPLNFIEKLPSKMNNLKRGLWPWPIQYRVIPCFQYALLSLINPKRGFHFLLPCSCK